MYCRECGSNVKNGAEFCIHCGFRPLNSNKHCQSCGIETKPHQEMCVQCREPLASSSKSSYAGFWIRFVALFIDSIIIGIPMFIIVMIFAFISLATMDHTYMYADDFMYWYESMQGLLFLFNALVGIIYFAGMHASKRQATIGKRIVGIKVTDLQGRRISFLRGIGRYFASLISGLLLYIGYIMVGLTQKKQGLHDKMAGTLVVKSK